jgi:hypothetical protein
MQIQQWLSFCAPNSSIPPGPFGSEELFTMAECHTFSMVGSKSRPAGRRRDSIGIEIAPFRSVFAEKKRQGFPLPPKIMA